MKKFRVTLKNPEFTYTMEIEADEKATMKEFSGKARKQIKKNYNVDIPADASFEMEFEIMGQSMIIKKPYVLEKIDKSSPDVSIFTFRSQDGTKVDLTPGMFAMLFYRDPQTGEEIGRAFSIANAPNQDHFEFMIAMIHGKITTKLEEAKIGDVYYISAPYGSFKFDANAGKKFLFIAGGTGIAPFFSMIRCTRESAKCPDMSMIYSVKYPQDIIEKDQLDAFIAGGLKLTITVTRPAPGDGWTGQTGHIDAEMIKKYAPDFAERVCYVCGPPKFIQALKEALISLGINERSINAEMWGE